MCCSRIKVDSSSFFFLIRASSCPKLHGDQWTTSPQRLGHDTPLYLQVLPFFLAVDPGSRTGTSKGTNYFNGMIMISYFCGWPLQTSLIAPQSNKTQWQLQPPTIISKDLLIPSHNKNPPFKLLVVVVVVSVCFALSNCPSHPGGFEKKKRTNGPNLLPVLFLCLPLLCHDEFHLIQSSSFRILLALDAGLGSFTIIGVPSPRIFGGSWKVSLSLVKLFGINKQPRN